jgi:hypothetical protein
MLLRSCLRWESRPLSGRPATSCDGDASVGSAPRSARGSQGDAHIYLGKGWPWSWPSFEDSFRYDRRRPAAGISNQGVKHVYEVRFRPPIERATLSVASRSLAALRWRVCRYIQAGVRMRRSISILLRGASSWRIWGYGERPCVAAGHCLRFCNESALAFASRCPKSGHATRRAVARRPTFPGGGRCRRQ